MHLKIVSRTRLPWLVAGIHLGVVLLTAVGILVGSEPDWPMAWIGFLVLDFPISLVFAGVNSLSSVTPSQVHLVGGDSPVNDVWNFIVPVLFFSMIGSAWWFLLGSWYQRRKATRAAGA
jgi:hypothetical protein